jgi:hypothetical protein
MKKTRPFETSFILTPKIEICSLSVGVGDLMKHENVIGKFYGFSFNIPEKVSTRLLCTQYLAVGSIPQALKSPPRNNRDGCAFIHLKA